MGQSTNGELWYGFVFEDGHEFPWDAEPFCGDIEEWWRKEQGFNAPDGDFQTIWNAEREFDKSNPCPAEPVNYCSGDYPMYGLSVRGTGRSASRGYPTRIEGIGISQGEIEPLKKFCEKYELKPEGEDGWWLSSYWG